MTNRDFFAKVVRSEKPDVGKKEWGGTIGGPIVRNKLHFFSSLERHQHRQKFQQHVHDPSRPQLDDGERRIGVEHAVRIDHQLSNKHTWAFRWLRESRAAVRPARRRPGNTDSSYGDETDLDQTHVGTLTSVLSDTKVNTFRVRRGHRRHRARQSGVARAEPDYARCVPCPDNAGARSGDWRRRDWTTRQFDIQAATTMDYSIQRGYSVDNTFSWFIPDAKGRHDIKFGAQ